MRNWEGGLGFGEKRGEELSFYLLQLLLCSLNIINLCFHVWFCGGKRKGNGYKGCVSAEEEKGEKERKRINTIDSLSHKPHGFDIAWVIKE